MEKDRKEGRHGEEEELWKKEKVCIKKKPLAFGLY
jgi:hypothetical protein